MNINSDNVSLQNMMVICYLSCILSCVVQSVIHVNDDLVAIEQRCMSISVEIACFVSLVSEYIASCVQWLIFNLECNVIIQPVNFHHHNYLLAE